VDVCKTRAVHSVSILNGVESVVVCYPTRATSSIHRARAVHFHVISRSVTSLRFLLPGCPSNKPPHLMSPDNHHHGTTHHQHGAHIVAEILSDEALYTQWRGELQMMSDRIKDMRKALYDALVANGTPGSWEHVINQIGMFSYLGIGKVEALRLRAEFHIYLTEQGRISMCGLNSDRAKVLADALKVVLTTTAEESAKL
jgi:Aminotransferase class I and II